MQLVITRPREDAGALARRLAALGHHPVLAPLIEIVPRTDYLLPQETWAAVAITSANGARSLCPGHRLGGVPVFTVGAQSMAASRAAGFENVTAAGGDVVQLAAHMAAALDPAEGPVLYLSGAETAGDLAGRLRTSGFDVRRVILYDAIAATRLPDGLADLASPAAVLLYSPRTARIWASLAAAFPALAALPHYCLSANVAEALGPAYMTRIASSPSDEGLLALLRD